MTAKPFAIAVAAMILLVAGSAVIPRFPGSRRNDAPADRAAAAEVQDAGSKDAGSNEAGSKEAGSQDPRWKETQWPFVLDEWGFGRAFVCMPADCGERIEVFIRPKIGFCNCTTGVSDETELERVADTDLVSPAVRPLGAATAVRIAWMNGLTRTYAVPGGGPPGRLPSGAAPPGQLVSIAVNDECDVVVALARIGTADPDRAAAAAVAFLRTPPVVLWVKKELGLEFVHREW